MLIERIGGWGEAHFSEPAMPAAVEAVEAQLGHRLPDELRALLAESDGIAGEYGLGLLWPAARIGSDNAHFRTRFAGLYMPFDGLVFFADGGNGDQFFISLGGRGEIFVWNHVDDSRTWVAPTVLSYLEQWMRGSLSI